MQYTEQLALYRSACQLKLRQSRTQNSEGSKNDVGSDPVGVFVSNIISDLLSKHCNAQTNKPISELRAKTVEFNFD